MMRPTSSLHVVLLAASCYAPLVWGSAFIRGEDPEAFKSLVEAETDVIDVRLRNWYP